MDEKDALLEKLKGMMGYDIILTTGGTSAGVGDLLYRVIEEVGDPGLLVHGIAIKPGKPTIIAVADEGWSISTRSYFNARPNAFTGATHGYDNLLMTMGATFIAEGPAFKEGLSVTPFQNIHIYELMCEVLGLTPAENYGSLDSVRAMLR